MRKNLLLLYSIVAVPILLLLVGFLFLQLYYAPKIMEHFEAKQKNIVDTYMNSNKLAAEAWTKEQKAFIEFRYKNVERELVKELQEKVYLAHNSATLFYKKHKGKKSDKEIKAQIVAMLKKISLNGEENFIFLNDYHANIVLATDKEAAKKYDAHYLDADGRSIVLEEIQKARKNGEGFLKSRVEEGVEVIFVKELGFYDLIVGSTLKVLSHSEYIKPKLFEIMKKNIAQIPHFIALYENQKVLFSTPELEQTSQENRLKFISNSISTNATWQSDAEGEFHYFSDYFAPLGWHVVYGFDMRGLDVKELQMQKDLQEMARSELAFVRNLLLGAFLLSVILSFIWLMAVSKLFEEVQTQIRNYLLQIKKLERTIESLDENEIEITLSIEGDK